MTTRQSVLKIFYPVLIEAGKLFGLKAGIKRNKDNITPPASFYHLKATAIDGTQIDFNQFQGKNVLIVNTASDCGYTNQLSDLKKLYELYQKELVVIGFPSNDFKQQEKLSNVEIASFCLINFGVSFPLTTKSVVIKGRDQSPVFTWLSNKNLNGWNNDAPEWNFTKYLVNKKGILINYFGPAVEPLSVEITANLT